MIKLINKIMAGCLCPIIAMSGCAAVGNSSSKELSNENSSSAITENPVTEEVTYPYKLGDSFPIFKSEPLTDEIISKITGVSYVENEHISLDELSLLTLTYLGFDDISYVGQMISSELVEMCIRDSYKCL